jgi:Skp family chaperone for outer membrane proteins
MKRFQKILPYVILSIIVAGSIVLWVQRERVLDWWYLRGYEPSAAIETLATDTMMTDYAQRLFFVNHPTLDDKQAFNQNCAGILEEVAVLGCYHGDRLGIYLYDVTDGRLHGIEQVTAAHEMLHQAYDRLSGKERQRVNNLLQDFYDNELDIASVREKIALYQKDGDHDIINEMHSIFATEVEDLPDDLENYYSQYFSDRSKVIAFHKQSRAAFEQFRQKISNYDKQLASIRQQIDNNESSLSTMLTELESERQRLDQLLASDQVEEYNTGVPAFNQRVNSYNGLLQTTQGLVEQYNRLVQERNDVAIQVSDLNAALDSRLTPQ